MVRPGGLAASSLAALIWAADGAGAEDATDFARAVQRADLEYARRAEGAQGAVALPGPIDLAIADYRKAVALEPDEASVRASLLRALFFRATFCGGGPEVRKALAAEARQVADEGVDRLERGAGEARGTARIEALRKVPGAGELLFWAAVSWGEWAQTHSRWAAVRARAPGRIRDLAQTVIDVDPTLQEGGGHLVLGRLHDKSPSIPIVSGFVSREKALANLRKAHGAFPGNTIGAVYLGEAILRHDPAHRDEAREVLARCARATPRPDYAVEDAHYIARARSLLGGM
jgi:hypothetical protein